VRDYWSGSRTTSKPAFLTIILLETTVRIHSWGGRDKMNASLEANENEGLAKASIRL
jgi:hypothetical protein